MQFIFILTVINTFSTPFTQDLTHNPNNRGFRGRVPRCCAGAEPLKIIPALTTCASKQMKTHRFSHFACIAAWSECERQSTRKAQKVAVCHFSTLNAYLNSLFYYLNISPDPVVFPIQSSGASKKSVPRLVSNCVTICHNSDKIMNNSECILQNIIALYTIKICRVI